MNIIWNRRRGQHDISFSPADSGLVRVLLPGVRRAGPSGVAADFKTSVRGNTAYGYLWAPGFFNAY